MRGEISPALEGATLNGCTPNCFVGDEAGFGKRVPVAPIAQGIRTTVGRPDVTEAAPSEHEDVQRLGAALNGDETAFIALMEVYSPRLLALSERLLSVSAEAEDVVQEVFVRLWNHGDRIEIGSAGLAPWLFRVTRNLCVDRLRRRRNQGDAGLEFIPADDDQSADLEAQDLARVTRMFVDKLPERQRTAIALFHFEGRSLAETAQALEVSIEAVESLLARGRRRLRSELADVWEDYFKT